MELINYLSLLIVPVFILFIVCYGLYRKINIYDSFVTGAKDSINITLKIFPNIIAIFIAIKVFQSSGAFDFVKQLLSPLMGIFNIPVEVLSIGLIKPLSNSASMGIFTEIIKTTGPDSLATMMAAVIMGSAETTFYVLAVYLGAAGIKKTKYLVPVCIISDIFGIIISIIVVRLLF
jgi:spore maturation protein B